MEIRARLDKDKRRVLCGDCDAYMAKVEEFFVSTERPRRRYRCIAFPAGWTQRSKDGVWALTRHAMQKRDQLHGISSRRPKKAIREMAERWSDLMPQKQSGVPVHDLPAEVICPVCRTRQLLDAELLGVESWPR